MLLLPVPLEEPLEEVPPLEVLERSAVELLPVPGLLAERFAPELVPAVLAPELLPMPLLELELASLRGEEVLEPLPVLEPVPVLLPEAPPAELDSRTSETITSGAASLGGKVTMATPKPFWMPLVPPAALLDEEPLKPLELEDEPLRPDELEALFAPVPLDEPEDELRPIWLPLPPLCELSRVTSLLLRPLDDEDPIPPLEEEEPDRPPEVPLVSERRLLLPVPPLVLLALPLESTGQLLISAGLITSPCTITRVS